MARERLNPKQWAQDHLEDMSISKVIPSALTLLGLCSGATAIKFALLQEWKSAVIAIFCAMIFDMLDGQAARWLGADSRFGAQLDSLADLVSFGLAPAVVVYSWSLSDMETAGWIGALIFCICSAIRLARFNIEAARDEGATQSHPYFTGLPTPAAAGVLLLPLLLTFEFKGDLFRDPLFSLGLIAMTSILMVSRVPTPSLKHMRFSRQGRIAAAALVGALVLLAIYVPWAMLITGLLVYLATIPFVISTLGVKTGTPTPLYEEPEDEEDLEHLVPPG
ncbi:MAG TPA: CDP-diacylglycerol--serine O-phosphatidyltransferase [Micropepsaceae bacterium]|nr:CDP-diacylglycerol--serine O-phosphatidyltransferase [Micropepsaceae bacterium]